MNWYMAGPIDYEQDQTWKDKLIEMCKGHEDTLLFDPNTYHFKRSTPAMAKYIHDINMIAVKYSDGVVAHWMKNQVSVGTPVELYYAFKLQRPVILVTDMMESVYLQYIGLGVDTTVVSNLTEAYGAILKAESKFKEKMRANTKAPETGLEGAGF